MQSLRPEGTDDKKCVPYSISKQFTPELGQAPTQLLKGTAASAAAAALPSQGTAQPLRAQYVRATVACQDCAKPRAVYCTQALRNLQKGIAEGGRLDSDSETCTPPRVQQDGQQQQREQGILDAATSDDLPTSAAEAAAAAESSSAGVSSGGRVTRSGQPAAHPSTQPSTYVCENDQFTCGASLMPDGHKLASDIYCNESLYCAAPIENTLYGCSASVLKSPLVHFDKGLCSICGAVQLTKAQRKEQDCSGDAQTMWSKSLPRCDTCAARGLTAAPVRKTKAASQAVVPTGKRRAASGQQHANQALVHRWRTAALRTASPHHRAQMRAPRLYLSAALTATALLQPGRCVEARGARALLVRRDAWLTATVDPPQHGRLASTRQRSSWCRGMA